MSYRHKVHYYETDRMGITHHSNYVRWMEEARIDFLEQIGWSYAKLEEEGIISPVTGVNCKYKQTTTFDDEVFITVKVKEYKGVRLVLEYLMMNAEGNVVCEASSEHCFVNAAGTFIRMKREYPEFHQVLVELVGKE